MASIYVLTPETLVLLAAAALLAGLSLFSWRRRTVPGALPLAAGALFVTLWLLGLAFEAAAVAPATKIAWHKFQAVLQVPAATAGACFALEYAQPGRWLTRRNLVLISIPSLLVLLFVVIDKSQLMWRDLRVGPDGSIVLHYAIPGAILVAVGAGLILVNFVALIWLFVRSPQHRWPVAILLFGALIARGLYLLSVFGVPLPVSVDPIVIAFGILWLVYAAVLFGFRIFDPLPAARHAVLEQMQAGFVVFDEDWQVVSLNPAAERMLGINADAAKGKTWNDLIPAGESLPTIPPADAQASGAVNEIPEFSLRRGPNMRHYTATVSPLRDFRDLAVGYLLLLHDVTEQSLSQAQIVEQQRALATLHERERLARELHDSIGQVLGYASFQADAARQLIDSGQAATAAGQLTRLATVLQDAHADVREHILNLRTTPSPQQSFFCSVQEYLEGFTNNYGIATRCTIGDTLDAAPFAPESQMQMFRILQEALSNARKHSGSQHVLVAFEDGEGIVRMSVADDGCGFDVDVMAAGGGSHMGLRFMRERVEELGGSLQVESSPGAGTRVIVEVPHEEN